MMLSAKAIDEYASIVPTLRAIPDIECALLYGSVARGDVECHSDVDILLVCRGNQKRQILKLVSTTTSDDPVKYSLTLYTRGELEFMTRAHSLFMLHLKREAVVLFDKSPEGFIGTLLQHVRPKPSYDEDFNKAISLLSPLAVSVSGAPNQFHRLAYVYALFRIYGVYLLARSGTYEFSKKRMANRLSSSHPDLASEIEALSSLRPLNNRFYTGSMRLDSLSGPDHNLQFYVHSLGTLVSRPVRVSESNYAEAVGGFLDATNSGPPRMNYGLRSWFLLLVYDGLNVFCVEKGLSPLECLNERQLRYLKSTGCPPWIQESIDTVLCYLQDYPLKYFLRRDAKIDTHLARRILQNLSSH